MKALDFLYRYSDLNRKVAELVEKAAIEEQVAKRHCDKELKKECLKKAEEYKSEATAYKTEQTKMEKLIYAMPASLFLWGLTQRDSKKYAQGTGLR